MHVHVHTVIFATTDQFFWYLYTYYRPEYCIVCISCSCGKSGFADVKRHAFFRGTEWSAANGSHGAVGGRFVQLRLLSG